MNEKEIIDKIKYRFSEKRWTHILGVRETAEKLANKYGANVEETISAALLHDYGKILDKDKLLNKAKDYNIPLEDIDYYCIELLHGPVGAKLVEEEIGISDREILKSIAVHTLGSEDMSILDKIIFLADMVEPSRDYPGVKELEELVFADLDKGLLMGFDRTITYVVAKGGFLHPQTIKSRNALLKGIQ